MRSRKYRQQKFPESLEAPARLAHMIDVTPNRLDETRLYYDRATDTLWREETCNGPSTWSYLRLERKAARPPRAHAPRARPKRTATRAR